MTKTSSLVATDVDAAVSVNSDKFFTSTEEFVSTPFEQSPTSPVTDMKSLNALDEKPAAPIAEEISSAVTNDAVPVISEEFVTRPTSAHASESPQLMLGFLWKKFLATVVDELIAEEPTSAIVEESHATTTEKSETITLKVPTSVTIEEPAFVMDGKPASPMAEELADSPITTVSSTICDAVVCIVLSAADIIIQARTQKTASGGFDYRNLIVVGASYVLLATTAALLSCSRMLTVRNSLQDIPKLYIPIKKQDLPESAFDKIEAEFESVKEIRLEAEPRPDDIQAVGWAKPGTPHFEGLDFKQIIARTPAFIEKVATGIHPDFSRPHSVSVRHYFEFLTQQGLVDKELGEFYLEGYEVARFSQRPLSQEYYVELMKHLAAILQNMGFTINQARNMTPQSTATTTDLYSRIGNNDSISFVQSHRTTPSYNGISEDQYSIYDEEEIRNDIYTLLMSKKDYQKI